MLRDSETILFQGDSITDGARSRNDDQNHVMGHGYAYLIAARLMADYPKRNYTCINRGVSGNRIVDVYARWQEDGINLNPSLVSLLVGINDVSAELIRSAGVPVSRFETVYRMLLEDTVEHSAEIRLVLCEPFFLPNPRREPHNDRYVEEVTARARVVEKLALEYNAMFVPLQGVFDSASKRRESEYWLWDGVHPTPQGHELVAREWLAAVNGEEW